MSELLNFLNNASAEELSGISGISENLAQKIIAARPFSSAESSLEVSGLGPSLLIRMEENMSQQKTKSAEMVAGTGEKPEKQLTVPKNEQLKPYLGEESPQPPKQKGGFGRALGRFFRFLFRLLLAVVIIGGIGAGVYYGLPYIQRTFIEPLNINTEQIRQIATQQAEDLAQVRTDLEAIDTRITTVEEALTTQTASITALEKSLATLDEDMATGDAALTSELKDQLLTTYALELISRARLYLTLSDFGMARQDLQTARDQLAQMEINPDSAAHMKDILMRLDLAIRNLPEFPVIASNDLEIAWYLLIE